MIAVGVFYSLLLKRTDVIGLSKVFLVVNINVLDDCMRRVMIMEYC